MTNFLLRRRQILKAGAMSAAALPFAGLFAQSAIAAPPSAPTGQVIVGLTQEPTKFNPLQVGLEVDWGVWMNVYSPLWTVDPTGQFLPRLAKEIPSLENGGISSDGLNWTIRLRDDVKWHDGELFTAEDVKYTLELIQNPDFTAASRNGHQYVRDITVVSPTELTFKMSQAYAPYLSIMAWTFIVPKHILGAAADVNDSPLNTAPVGTGPFKWAERVAGDHITLEANADYFGDGPYLERLVFKYIPDQNVMYTQFQAGEIDHTGLLGISNDKYAEASKLPGKKVVAYSAPSIETIVPNHEFGALKDKAVLQALYAAINKEAIVDSLYYGLPTAAESVVPKEHWAFAADLPAHEFSIEKANQILDEAGWERGGDAIRVKDGVRLEFAISTTVGASAREQMEQLLQQDFAAIGCQLNINNMPAAVLFGEFYGQSQFEAVVSGANYMKGADPEMTDRLASTAIPVKGGSGRNVSQYQNARVDELLAAGVVEFDQAKRAAIYREIQHIIHDELAVFPIFQYAYVQGVKDTLIGFIPNANVLANTWNCETWYWQA